jgi:hypothetical protein
MQVERTAEQCVDVAVDFGHLEASTLIAGHHSPDGEQKWRPVQ